MISLAQLTAHPLMKDSLSGTCGGVAMIFFDDAMTRRRTRPKTTLKLTRVGLNEP